MYELKEKHIKFLSENFNVSVEDIDSLDNDAFFELFDKVVDIEVDEVNIPCYEKVSERGNIAADITTYMCKHPKYNS